MKTGASQTCVLRDVASQINSGGDLDTLLRSLIDAACEHGNWALGSIMAIDAVQGQAHVIVRHDPSRLRRQLADTWQLATSPALSALQRNEPVYIRDARAAKEYPGYQREAAERDYRTVLVLPMGGVDREGRPMVLTVAARQIVDVSQDDLAFMGMIVHLGDIAIEREHRLLARQLAAEQLQKALQVQMRLLQEVLAGGETDNLTGLLTELVGEPVMVVDFPANTASSTKSPVPASLDDAQWRKFLEGPMGDQIVAAIRSAYQSKGGGSSSISVTHDGGKLEFAVHIEPLAVDGQTVGALATFPDAAGGGGDLKRLLLDSAKFALSVQLMRGVIRFRSETRTLTEIFFELVERRWRNVDDLVQRCRRVGLSMGSKTLIVVVDFPSDAPVEPSDGADSQGSAMRLARQMNVQAHVIAIGGGLACLFQNHEPDKAPKIDRYCRRLLEVLRYELKREPILVVGGVCEAVESYPVEWERCWRMVKVARSFGRSGIFAGVDFGPIPMLIDAVQSVEVRGFVDSTIGSILEHDKENGTPYLETLSAYIRVGCRAQACADSMGLHVTTLRYRLTRIEELFGINPDSADNRFAMDLALRLHQVTGSK